MPVRPQFGGFFAACVMMLAVLLIPASLGGCNADGSPAGPETVLPTPADVAELRERVEQAERTKAAVLSDAQQAVAVAQAVLAEARAATTRPGPDGTTISPEIQAKILDVARASEKALARAEADAMALNARADEVLGKLTVGLKSLERGLVRDEQGQIDPAGVGGAVGTAVGLVPGGQAFAPLAGLATTLVVGIWGAIATKKRREAEADAATKFRQLTEVVKSVEALYEGQSKPKEDVLLLASVQSMDTREVVEKLTK